MDMRCAKLIDCIIPYRQKIWWGIVNLAVWQSILETAKLSPLIFLQRQFWAQLQAPNSIPANNSGYTVFP